MDTSQDLRREVWRLLQEAQGFTDPEVKRELAARAFVLAQRAEIIERNSLDDSRGQQAPSAAEPVREPLGCAGGAEAAGRPRAPAGLGSRLGRSAVTR